MFYYVFRYLESIDFPGAGIFEYISFRSAMAIITAIILATFFGKKVISFLQKKQIGEEIRDLGLEGQMSKKGTPTMGGIIIIFSIIIPVLLFAKLENIYVILLIITTLWMGFVGFMDDYIKVFKKNKKGIKGKFKLFGQVLLAVVVSLILLLHNDVVIREKNTETKIEVSEKTTDIEEETLVSEFKYIKSTKTTIPFFKNNEFDYAYLVPFNGKYLAIWIGIVFTLVVILIITSVSNGANITDGLDGLSAGVSVIVGATLGIFAYVSGHKLFAEYLNIMYIPNTGEMVVFIAAFIGAIVGFMWYNSYPAQIFMGDTGSLTLGSIIAVFAIAVRKELLIPILCGIFLIENLSVILQVGYFKYTKKRFGEGKRIFKMAPLHHHFQKLNLSEPKIVTRFWIIAVFLAVLTILTLKIR